MYVWIDLHALSMNNFEHRVLRIGRINTALQRSASSVRVKCTSNNCCGVCSSSAPAMLYYLLRFLILQRCSRRQNNISISQESTAVQRCARKSTEFASG